MSHLLCYRLTPVASSIIGHGLQETTYRFLVERRDASELGDQPIFYLSKRIIWQCCANAIDDVAHVKTKLTGGDAQVRRRGIAGTRFIIALGSFRDAKFFGELILCKPRVSAQLSKPGADLF